MFIPKNNWTSETSPSVVNPGTNSSNTEMKLYQSLPPVIAWKQEKMELATDPESWEAPREVFLQIRLDRMLTTCAHPQIIFDHSSWPYKNEWKQKNNEKRS